MGLFNFKKEEKKNSAPAVRKVAVKEAAVLTATGVADRGRILQNPRVTEKVTFLAEKDNVYTFNVTADATKQTVSELITRLYKVHPTKVHILPVPSKRVFVRGKRGVKRGGRKAYVFLKKGEKIELV